MTTIRPFEDADWPAVWDMLAPIFRAGETYAVPRDITEDAAHRFWIEAPEATFVATDIDGAVLASYFLKPNHQGPGDHVCNCGYATAAAARGRGLAGQLCRHSQEEALRRGYRAMQYNCVVASNEGAVRLWQREGFEIVGTLPEAFRHPRLGFVDAFVMVKRLIEG